MMLAILKGMIRRYHSKQTWRIGDKVKVGFLTGFEIVAMKAVYDYLPDLYLLRRNDVYYRFIPHHGLTRLGVSAGCIPEAWEQT
jgi:hypothetical protein